MHIHIYTYIDMYACMYITSNRFPWCRSQEIGRRPYTREPKSQITFIHIYMRKSIEMSIISVTNHIKNPSKFEKRRESERERTMVMKIRPSVALCCWEKTLERRYALVFCSSEFGLGLAPFLLGCNRLCIRPGRSNPTRLNNRKWTKPKQLVVPMYFQIKTVFKF